MVTVPPVLVKRRKTHFHTLPCGASVILGNNGYIWIGPIAPEEQPMETWEEPESKKVHQFEIKLSAVLSVFLVSSP